MRGEFDASKDGEQNSIVSSQMESNFRSNQLDSRLYRFPTHIAERRTLQRFPRGGLIEEGQLLYRRDAHAPEFICLPRAHTGELVEGISIIPRCLLKQETKTVSWSHLFKKQAKYLRDTQLR